MTSSGGKNKSAMKAEVFKILKHFKILNTLLKVITSPILKLKYNYKITNFVMKIQLQNPPEVIKIVIKILLIEILPNTADRVECGETSERSCYLPFLRNF